MERFNKEFNDIDPESGRPFSYGHPDGAWVLAIVFGLLSIGTIVSAVLSVTQGEEGALAVAAGLLIVLFMLTTIVFFTFKRSKISLNLSVILLAIVFLGFLFQALNNPGQVLPALIPVLILGVTCIYLYGLQKDKLIR